MSKTLYPLLPLLFAAAVAEGQDWERESVDLAQVESRALDLANRDYQAPDKEALPEWMKGLSYDQ